MNVSRFLRSCGGATAVEFAIVLPILIMMLCGIFVYGTYIGASHSVAQLAADAARASVAGLTDDERETIARSHVERSVDEYLLLVGEKVTVDAAPLPSDPSIYQVAVNYDATSLPIFGLGKLLPLPSPSIVRTASIRRGGM